MSMHDLWALEKGGQLIYGTPLGPRELEDVVSPTGHLGPGIRPSVPTTWDFESRQLIPHFTDQPKVCAGTLATLAVVRGLGQQHPELSPAERSHGWVITTGESGELNNIHLFATAALVASIKRKGPKLVSWLYGLGKPADPFKPVAELPFEYRSPQPAMIDPNRAYPISGTWFPMNYVQIIKPFDQYECEAEWLKDLGLPPADAYKPRNIQTCAFTS